MPLNDNDQIVSCLALMMGDDGLVSYAMGGTDKVFVQQACDYGTLMFRDVVQIGDRNVARMSAQSAFLAWLDRMDVLEPFQSIVLVARDGRALKTPHLFAALNGWARRRAVLVSWMEPEDAVEHVAGVASPETSMLFWQLREWGYIPADLDAAAAIGAWHAHLGVGAPKGPSLSPLPSKPAPVEEDEAA